MANTTNLNLYKPSRDDYISVTRDISDNMQKIDDAYGAMDSSITNLSTGKARSSDIAIVVTGNTSTKNITAGDFVVVMDSTISGVTDGLYIATANITAGSSVTSASLSGSDTGNGGFNTIGNRTNHQYLFLSGTLLDAINSLKSKGIPMPYSIQKAGSSSISDFPDGLETLEANIIVYGDNINSRWTVELTEFPTQGGKFIRHGYINEWLTSWTCLMPAKHYDLNGSYFLGTYLASWGVIIIPVYNIYNADITDAKVNIGGTVTDTTVALTAFDNPNPRIELDASGLNLEDGKSYLCYLTGSMN